MSTTGIEDLIAVTERLAALVDQETAMIKAHRMDEMSRRMEEKSALSEAYRSGFERLREDPALLSRSAPAQVERLKAAARLFSDYLERHRRTVNSAKTVTERILRAIGDEVSKRQYPVTVYGQNALMAGGGAGAAPVAVNQFI